MSVLGLFPQFSISEPVSIKIKEDVQAVGGIIRFKVTGGAGNVVLYCPPRDPHLMDMHVTDDKGNVVFRLKRGMLDHGFVAEGPDGKKLFKVHKKHFTSSPGLEAIFSGPSGNDSILYHFDRQEITHKGQSVAKITERTGDQRKYCAEDEYTVDLVAGLDGALVAALCICADQYICDRRSEGYTSP